MERRRESIEPGLIAAHVGLAAHEFADGPMVDPVHLDWKYLHNPAGPAFADEMWDGDELVGRLVHLPKVLRLDGRPLRAINVVDVLVHPAYRPKGVFLRLAGGLFDVPDRDVVFFAPNDTSAPIYEKLLRIEPVAHLDLHALPLRPDRVLGQAKPPLGRATAWTAPVWAGLVGRWARRRPGRGLTITDAVPTSAELDALAGAAAAPGVLVGDRSAAFHAWRFDDRLFRYRVRYCRRGDALVGYVVTRAADVEGLRAQLLVDVVVDPAAATAGSALVRDAVARALADDLDLVVALSVGDAPVTRSLRRLPLVPVPRRFLPQAAPLMARAPVGADPLPAGVGFALSLADFDVY